MSSFGTLKDGRKYGVYRCLLYCDGFNQYVNKKGSAGGCYLLPLSLPYRYRTSHDAVRVVALTPPGVSTRDALLAIVPDLVQGSTAGFPAVDEDGNEIQVFIEVVGYVGDYPEVTDKVDIVGHTGSCPCHVCSFRRFNGASSEGSAYCLQRDAHSADSAFLRFAARTDAIREVADAEGLNRIGLKRNSESASDMSPLFAFALELRKMSATQAPPLTSDGKPVVEAIFDPYRSCFVSPDHLLAGIATNAITMVFKLLPNDASRCMAESLICGGLRLNDLIPQQQLYCFEKKALYSMSLSSVFCVLILSPASFTESIEWQLHSKQISYFSNDLRDALEILREFKVLVSETYWYPRVCRDGVEAVRIFNEDG